MNIITTKNAVETRVSTTFRIKLLTQTEKEYHSSSSLSSAFAMISDWMLPGTIS